LSPTTLFHLISRESHHHTIHTYLCLSLTERHAEDQRCAGIARKWDTAAAQPTSAAADHTSRETARRRASVEGGRAEEAFASASADADAEQLSGQASRRRACWGRSCAIEHVRRRPRAAYHATGRPRSDGHEEEVSPDERTSRGAAANEVGEDAFVTTEHTSGSPSPTSSSRGGASREAVRRWCLEVNDDEHAAQNPTVTSVRRRLPPPTRTS
jgi:hypothetical protein